MKINFNKSNEFTERIDAIVLELRNAHQGLLNEITVLQGNSGVDEIILHMKSTAKKLEDEIFKMLVMKASVNKIVEVCRAGEARVVENIDCSMEYKKSVFKSKSVINDSSSFDWSIE